MLSSQTNSFLTNEMMKAVYKINIREFLIGKCVLNIQKIFQKSIYEDVDQEKFFWEP